MSFKYPFSILLLLCMTSCASNKKNTNDTAGDVPAAFQGKLLVTLMPDTETRDLEEDFSKYELKYLSIASRSQNQHLFQYNPSKISGEDLMKKLNRSKKVYNAESLVTKMTKATLMGSNQNKQLDIK